MSQNEEIALFPEKVNVDVLRGLLEVSGCWSALQQFKFGVTDYGGRDFVFGGSRWAFTIYSRTGKYQIMGLSSPMEDFQFITLTFPHDGYLSTAEGEGTRGVKETNAKGKVKTHFDQSESSFFSLSLSSSPPLFLALSSVFFL